MESASISTAPPHFFKHEGLAENAALITDMIRRIRATLDRVAQERGRPQYLHVRTGHSQNRRLLCPRIGCPYLGGGRASRRDHAELRLHDVFARPNRVARTGRRSRLLDCRLQQQVETDPTGPCLGQAHVAARLARPVTVQLGASTLRPRSRHRPSGPQIGNSLVSRTAPGLLPSVARTS